MSTTIDTMKPPGPSRRGDDTPVRRKGPFSRENLVGTLVGGYLPLILATLVVVLLYIVVSSFKSTPNRVTQHLVVFPAGLPDRAPKAWDEMAQWGPKLQAAVPGIQHAFQHPALADYAGWSFQNLLWGCGGGWSKENSFDVTCDSSESVAAIKFLQDSVHTGKWAGVASKDSTTDLSSGAVSATVASTGSLVGIVKAAQFQVGAGFLPGGPQTSDNICPTGGAGLGIPKKAPKENQLAAATFVKFLTSPENAALFSQATGYIPIRKSADTSKIVAATPQSKVAIDQLARTRPQDYARVFFPGADQEMAKTCANILTSQKDVQSELTALKSTLQGIDTNDVKPNI